MPNNMRAPSHEAIYDVAAERFASKLAGVGLHRDSVRPIGWYARRLINFGPVVGRGLGDAVSSRADGGKPGARLAAWHGPAAGAGRGSPTSEASSSRPWRRFWPGPIRLKMA